MNKYQKKYSAFQRHILKEFLSEKELKKIDILYNVAKMSREVRKAKLKFNETIKNKLNLWQIFVKTI